MLKNTLVQIIFKKGLKAAACVGSEFCNLTPEMEKLLSCEKDIKTRIVDDSKIDDPNWELPKVIIIGAGIAGLSAAQRLVKNGITDVTVVEATDRAGGRIHSCWLGDVVTEVGATHFYGTTVSNSALTLAAQEDKLQQPLMKETSTKGLMMTSEGEVVSPFVTAAGDACFKTILKQASDLFVKCGPGLQCGNLFNFISNRMDEEVQLFPSQYRSAAARVMVNKMVEQMSIVGAELDKVSACQFGTIVEIPGGNIRIPTGMVGILAPLLRDMPKHDTIKYCKPVTKIVYKDKCSNRVHVFCADGDLLCADYVIITCSLGVLKDKAKTMFVPQLPDEKLQAIEDIGYGHINHIYLEYAKPFWVWSEGSMRLGWNFHEIGDCADWMRAVSSITELSTSQQILQITIGGPQAKRIETLSDVTIAEDITKTHRKFLKNQTLPYPANVLKSKWSESPFYLGAKSYFGLKTTVESQCNLTKPFPLECGDNIPALLFAGEATAVGGHGTMHGARNSGIREAERILRITKKLQGKPAEPESAEDKAVANL